MAGMRSWHGWEKSLGVVESVQMCSVTTVSVTTSLSCAVKCRSFGEDGLEASGDLCCVFPAFSDTIDTKRSGSTIADKGCAKINTNKCHRAEHEYFILRNVFVLRNGFEGVVLDPY